MSDAISIALSGLDAATKRVAASASNIANAADTSNPADSTAAYTPIDTVQISATAANGSPQGTTTQFVPRDPASVTVYAPSDSNADANGLVNLPNVDLGTEIVSMEQAAQAYKANLAVVRTASDMSDALLNSFDRRV